MTLAVHELMTNALKFGALSVPAGRLAISWRIETREDGPQRIALDWIETGLHLVANAHRPRGFGSVVLLDMLKHSLGARIDLRFETTGLICQIRMPATDRILAR